MQKQTQVKDAASLVQSAAVGIVRGGVLLRHYLRGSMPIRRAWPNFDRRIADVHGTARKFASNRRAFRTCCNKARSLGFARRRTLARNLIRTRALRRICRKIHQGRSCAHAIAECRNQAILTRSRSLRNWRWAAADCRWNSYPREASALGVESCEFMVCAHERPARRSLSQDYFGRRTLAHLVLSDDGLHAAACR